MCISLVGKFDAKSLLVRLRCRWEDNIRMVLQEVQWGCGINLFASGQGQVLCSSDCDKGNWGSIKRWEFLDQLTAC
jgi:hypothetical protein